MVKQVMASLRLPAACLMSGGHHHEATLHPFQILSKKYDIIKTLRKICALLGILKVFIRKDLAWLDKSWRHSDYLLPF